MTQENQHIDPNFKYDAKWTEKQTDLFYERIEKIRNKHKLSKREFSFKLNKADNWWQRCLKQKRQIGWADLMVLSKIFKIRPADILKEE